MTGNSLTPTTESLTADVAAPDEISVGRWFLVYGTLLLAAAVPLWLLAMRQDWATESWWGGGLGWRERMDAFADVFRTVSPALKLLAFAVYLSLCCTFLPLPTGWIVAAVATREAAVAASLSDDPVVVAAVTTVVVAAAGAVGSTIANLNDYHLFTWILRHRGVAKVRNTRTYRAAARWFARAPGLILVIFNVVPIPVDVVRMLAATSRYPRLPFAVANFIGRFLRYAVIAFVTYWWDLGWVAVVALLGLAVILAAGKGLRPLARKLFARTNVSGSQESAS